MREFSREKTGIRFGKLSRMGIKMNSNGNADGTWYPGMGGNENDKYIHFPRTSSVHKRIRPVNAMKVSASRVYRVSTVRVRV